MEFIPEELANKNTDNGRNGVVNLIKNIQNGPLFSVILIDTEYIPGYLFMKAPFMRRFAQYYLGFQKGKIRITIISDNETRYSTSLVNAVMDDRVHPGTIAVAIDMLSILAMDLYKIKLDKIM